VFVLRFLMTVFVIVLIAVAQTATASAAGVSPAAAAEPPAEPVGIGVRLLDIPASTRDDPRARTYIVDRLAPGREISRRIKVENNTPQAQTVRVYPGAAHIEAGSFVGENAGSVNEVSSWIKVAQSQVDLPAGGSADVPVRIKVPADAPEGEQYGAVWAEVRGARDHGGVVQANRVGIRVYLSVGGGNGKPADFSVTSLVPARDQNGNPQLSVLIANTGGRALDITGALRLAAGPGGLSAGPFSIRKAATIAPGKAQNVTFVLSAELPNGPWAATATLKSGLVERKTTGAVTFPGSGSGPGGAVTPAKAEETPWLAFGSLAAATIIVLVTAMLLMQRRRRNGRTAMLREGSDPGARRSNRQRNRAT
jgi:hypothetical protein